MPKVAVTGPFPTEALEAYGVKMDDVCECAADLFNVISASARKHDWSNGQVLPALGVAIALYLREAPDDARKWLANCCWASCEDFDVEFAKGKSN
jgi:hypothetical protein